MQVGIPIIKKSKMTIEERFWEKVDKKGKDECWNWKGGKDSHGYGEFYYNKAMTIVQVHRLSWIVNNGDIPDGLYVLHSCDNPACVNPKHLFLGTHQDNMKDKVHKGRQSTGEDCYNAKLTYEKVKELRDEYINGVRIEELSMKYGISTSGICDVVHNKRWKDNNYKPPSDRGNVGENHPRAKLIYEEVCQIKERRKNGEKVKDLAREFDVSIATVSLIVNNKRW